ncbi:TetR/AcrR family transcriptional regulator [Acidobacteria bacterium AB60]|nr:TetR/AcrR family transcriptional regulator [Acidobacteria bacterium AB60]
MSDQSNSAGERSAETRARILDAALREFAAHGLAGARTERIASAAGVNKALLYYHFDSKEKLYLAAFEKIAERVRDNTMAVLMGSGTAGERVLRAALAHFDRIIGQQEFQSLMQQEMMRLHKGESGVMPVLLKRVFEPALILYRTMVREAVDTGEIIKADWMQIQLSSLGANVFYFLSAPIWKMIHGEDPLSLEALTSRRKAIVEFLGQALFTDRTHGAELAAKVIADTPMPAINGYRVNLGRNV